MPGFDEAMLEKLLDSMRAKSAPELARLLRGSELRVLRDFTELAASRALVSGFLARVA